MNRIGDDDKISLVCDRAFLVGFVNLLDLSLITNSIVIVGEAKWGGFSSNIRGYLSSSTKNGDEWVMVLNPGYCRLYVDDTLQISGLLAAIDQLGSTPAGVYRVKCEEDWSENEEIARKMQAEFQEVVGDLASVDVDKNFDVTLSFPNGRIILQNDYEEGYSIRTELV